MGEKTYFECLETEWLCFWLCCSITARIMS